MNNNKNKNLMTKEHEKNRKKREKKGKYMVSKHQLYRVQFFVSFDVSMNQIFH